MTEISPGNGKKQRGRERILLALLPTWDPLIPPLGIGCLRGFLRGYGYNVELVDANVEEHFRGAYEHYFNCLHEFIPAGKRRHLYNIGHEVLKNHMMAHIHHTSENGYRELIKIVVYKTFYHRLSDDQVDQLVGIISEYYVKLREYLLHLLKIIKPTVMGLSVYSGTLASSLFAFRLAKEKYPHITTVMGGAIFSGELCLDSPNFEYFLESTPYIDKIIVGEGEQLFLKLLQGELPESQRVFSLQDLGGKFLDISSAVIPDFSGLDTRYYAQMAAYTSRSCPFQCTFCVETTYWGAYRKKSGRQIVNELIQLSDRYGSPLFLMCDSLLNPVINDLSGAFINVDKSLYWGGYLRVDRHVCDTENTLKWRRAGFYRARLGIESGSQRILDMMGKKITVAEVKAAVSSLAYAGIKTTAMFVIGYPGETGEDFQRTLDLVEELRDDIYEADCNPFWYFWNGQVNAGEWEKKYNRILLYPASAKDMLILQTWILDAGPSRQETYERVNRFLEHCQKLRVPNPYSLLETRDADIRWKTLHRNAVPTLVDLKSSDFVVDEGKHIQELSLAVNKPVIEGDWDF